MNLGDEIETICGFYKDNGQPLPATLEAVCNNKTLEDFADGGENEHNIFSQTLFNQIKDLYQVIQEVEAVIKVDSPGNTDAKEFLKEKIEKIQGYITLFDIHSATNDSYPLIQNAKLGDAFPTQSDQTVKQLFEDLEAEGNIVDRIDDWIALNERKT